MTGAGKKGLQVKRLNLALPNFTADWLQLPNHLPQRKSSNQKIVSKFPSKFYEFRQIVRSLSAVNWDGIRSNLPFNPFFPYSVTNGAKNMVNHYRSFIRASNKRMTIIISGILKHQAFNRSFRSREEILELLIILFCCT